MGGRVCGETEQGPQIKKHVNFFWYEDNTTQPFSFHFNIAEGKSKNKSGIKIHNNASLLRPELDTGSIKKYIFFLPINVRHNCRPSPRDY